MPLPPTPLIPQILTSLDETLETNNTENSPPVVLSTNEKEQPKNKDKTQKRRITLETSDESSSEILPIERILNNYQQTKQKATSNMKPIQKKIKTDDPNNKSLQDTKHDLESLRPVMEADPSFRSSHMKLWCSISTPIKIQKK